MKNIFVHHVFFWLNEPENAEAARKLTEGLLTLGKIGEVVEIHIGVPAKTQRDVVDNTYSHSLLTIFRDKEDHDLYQVNPIHLKFIEDYGKLWKKVVVYDCVDAKL
jgi:hypothetical protein